MCVCVRVRVRGIGCRHLHEETWVNDVLSFVCVFVCVVFFNKNQQWLMIGESSQTIGCKDVKQAPQTLLLPASQHLL